jgi:hypothetical protein
MNTNRRQILKGLALGAAGSTFLGPMMQNVMALQNGGRAKKRFVFVVQSNGFDAIQACPSTIPYKEYKDREKFQNIDLMKHKLPKGFAPLEKHKRRVTIIQGLSGKVTGGGHSTWGGCLGLYRIPSPGNQTPQNITIDYKLGQTLPGILPWLGVGMDSGNRSALLNISSPKAGKTVPIILNPEIAYNAYFGVVAGGESTKDFHVKRNILDYMKGDVKRAKKALGPEGAHELDAYLSAYDELAKRQYSLLENEKSLKNCIPKYDKRFTSKVATTRAEAQFELVTSALIGGLSNVATITVHATEINAQPYHGIGIQDSLHGIGHGGGNKLTSKGLPLYEKYRSWTMGLVSKMVDRFEAIKEGNGTMMDNTIIVYLSDAPDTHHSKAMEFPFVVIGKNDKLNLGGKYLDFPGYGKRGHYTANKFYNSLVHSAGKQEKVFGHMEKDLDENMQTGVLKEIMV